MICDIRDKYEVVGRNTELTLSALRRAISVTTLDLCNDHVFIHVTSFLFYAKYCLIALTFYLEKPN